MFQASAVIISVVSVRIDDPGTLPKNEAVKTQNSHYCWCELLLFIYFRIAGLLTLVSDTCNSLRVHHTIIWQSFLRYHILLFNMCTTITNVNNYIEYSDVMLLIFSEHATFKCVPKFTSTIMLTVGSVAWKYRRKIVCKDSLDENVSVKICFVSRVVWWLGSFAE